MRFIKAHIYGFGKWLDEPFTFNERGITCIIGDNESGKSTFQAFISFMLFGLSPKEREFYRPKTSGTLGGELVILLKSGEEVTIRRMDGQKNCAAICQLVSGEEKDEEWLITILKGMTSELFASTFQFTTEDLYEFEQIEFGQIGEVLLNASISGASHMHQVEKQLESEMNELFKPRGMRPKINEQLNHLENMQHQLDEHAHMTEDYRELIEKIAQSKNNMNTLQQQIVEARKKRITWEQVETALPFIQQYEQTETRLNKSEYISFNEDGPEELAERKRLKQEYMSNDAIIQQNIDRYVKEMEDLALLHIEVVETGNIILQEKEDWSYHIRVQNDLEREKENIQTEIHTRMNPFVKMLPVDQLDDMFIPPFIEKKWRNLAREAHAVDDSRIVRTEAIRNEKEASKQMDEKIKDVSTDILPKEKVNALKETLDKDQQAASNKAYMQQIEQETFEQKQKTRASYQQSLKNLLGSNALAILFVLLAIFTKVPWFYHGAIISAALGWIQWFFKRKEYITLKDATSPFVIGVDVLLSENERMYAQEQMDAHIQATESILFFERRKEEAEQTYLDLQGKLDELTRDEQLVNKKIEEEVLLYPFLDQIELPYWEEVGYVLRDVQVLHTKLGEVRTHIKDNKNDINTFEQKVQDYAEVIFEEAVRDPVPLLLSRIEQILQDDVKVRQRHEKVNFEKQEAVAKQKQIKYKLDQVTEEMHAILLASNVHTEEEFLKQHEKYVQQQQLLQQVEDAKRQLVQIFSSSTWDQYIHKNVESHTINYELLKYRERIANCEKELEEVRSALATENAELKQLEKSDSLSYSEQMHAFEVEKELLQELATKWASRQVANLTLEQTKQTYISKHLDAVLERAAEHFTTITGNRYINIHVDASTTKLSVVDTNNIYYTPRELSKGTRDQLYIAIRLAMSQHIQENTPFPFLFDDSFVHFDKIRTERMMQLIIRIGENQQVILFTCKDDIQEIVRTYTGENKISMVRFQ